MVFGVSLEMQSDSKSYVSVQDDEITELVHTIKSQRSLSDRRPRSRIRTKYMLDNQNCSLNSHRKPCLNVVRVFDIC